MTYAQAKKVDADLIPVIDIAPLRDGTDPNGVAQALHAANKGLGFIYITGHGIPNQVIEAARDSAYAFFRGPEAKKQTIKISSTHGRYSAGTMPPRSPHYLRRLSDLALQKSISLS